MPSRLAAGLVALLLVVGCQGSGGEATPAAEPATTATEPATTGVPPATTSTPPATTSPVEQATTDQATMERVVRAWSDNLNAGDNEALARLFALPALIAQVDGVGEFTSYEQIAAFFALLPCSGTVVSIAYDEPDVALAVFELGDRTTSPCDATPGTLAAARFVFRDGKLIVWQQVPVPGEQTPTEPADVVA
jgi:hypothetical protein